MAQSIFAEFCSRNRIRHIKSPPYHPQSNGQAKRFVDTLKRSLLKLRGKSESALRQFLLSYRSTPMPKLDNATPAELFLARPIRTTLSLLNPTTLSHGSNDQKMETQFNRHHGAKKRAFEAGQLVFCRDYRHPNQRWILGKIISRHSRVLYSVEINGKREKRHANQLRARPMFENTADLIHLYDWDNTDDHSDSIAVNDTMDGIQNGEVDFQSLMPLVPVPVPESIIRRSQRQHKSISRLNMNPSKKTYS